ncbi:MULTISPECIES: cobalt-precorrin-6A reductase [unclassified Sphingobium]|jgi:precorrin-6A/cobalt-precorrin-6A reductase|uniref:cobalt-precorrin-6A reductase n=1 Tax=unclassified Sphingobium TaxID=2611147 RepID=UPI000451AA0D|nr:MULTISPECIES: cobalt-precorrin-6A reductase [unclassified Sphingobium]EXS69211.1 cobalt-precorrin-6X reductase [Sphingobium sp. Ant17]KFL46257.1 precorrin-6X reductase [Sphingobium sp. ba1]MDT7531983.1 cobalt-precorrin-6A reductase [Sphingobium sp. SA2]PBN42565.1 cobalt-precorrin-6A reductase [Sphingobium sp. D43FB]
MRHVLLLGGTTEASVLARLLAAQGIATTLSYAGRTKNPRAQPVPVRVGGFGGMAGLTDYLRDHRVTHLVDATHPFAATMSRHAVEAARLVGVAHVAVTRRAWEPVAGDRWTRVADIDGAVAALAGQARRVMLALGRMHVEAFAAQPHHHYLLRFVDAPEQPPGLPHHTLIVDRGPFTVMGDSQLMQAHAIDLVVCKNAGGSGADAKLIAARALGLPVLMIDRPAVPGRTECYRPEDVLAWLGHDAEPKAERGV